ncbi:hypothetical protein C1J01_48325, partial [Nonomuraea aridisoli]
MAQAAAVASGVMAYGVLLDPEYVGVLVACAPGVPRPPSPWIVDDDDPRLWWLERGDVTPYFMGPAPLLVALGADEEHVVLLDVLSGPVTVAVQGEPRLARAVVASVAAQLDARLPMGAVTVAAGVHDRHPGPDQATTIATARHRALTTGTPSFAVCAAFPGVPEGSAGSWPTAGVPEGSAGSWPAAPVRVVVSGAVRGTARLVVAHADGTVNVHGTPLRADARALPRALASMIRALPPYRTPDAPNDGLTERHLPTRDATP